MRRSVVLLLAFMLMTMRVGNAIHLSDAPAFSVVDYSFSKTPAGVSRLNATIQNDGEEASAKIATAFIEKMYFEMELENGAGSLNESYVGLDLNGDEDINDKFPINWRQPAENYTRRWDAVIAGRNVFGLYEGPLDDPGGVKSYYFEGEEKLFRLDNESSLYHFLYMASNNFAAFGFDTREVLKVPSPFFVLYFSMAEVTADNFRINEETVKANFTTRVQEVWSNGTRGNSTLYFVTNEMGIDAAEEVNFLCEFVSKENTTSTVFLNMEWSPDGNARYRWNFFSEKLVLKAGTVTSTTTTTTTTTTEEGGAPGFLLIPVLSVMTILLVFKKLRKRK
ncbi:MAG: hypothetical protein JSV04_12175 [Candidatus Heimdallarchaeota archaeon]|nr:MAG: hypothetical protein JSV04_12175 [Candidatus Heimdallarchaeota archaeon]